MFVGVLCAVAFVVFLNSLGVSSAHPRCEDLFYAAVVVPSVFLRHVVIVTGLYTKDYLSYVSCHTFSV